MYSYYQDFSSESDSSLENSPMSMIRVSVMNRIEVKLTKHGDKWFLANVTDEHKNRYVIKFFKEAAAHYDRLINQGASYLIEKPDADEIKINDCTWQILPCTMQTNKPSNPGNLRNTPFVPLSQVKNKTVGDKINTAAYVKLIGSSIQGKKLRRKVNLIDETNSEVEMILWENFADSISFSENSLIFIQNAKVSECQDRKGIASTDRMIIVSNPQEFPRDHPTIERLKNWQPQTIITNRSNNSVPQQAQTNQHPPDKTCKIQEIRSGTKNKFFDANVIISSVESSLSNVCYFKCSVNCRRKKIILEDSDNMIFKCESCGVVPTFAYVLKMTVTDETGSLPVVAFGDIAQSLIGIEAKKLQSLKFEDEDQAETYLQNICKKRFHLLIVVDEKEFNGQFTKEFKVIKIKQKY